MFRINEWEREGGREGGREKKVRVKEKCTFCFVLLRDDNVEMQLPTLQRPTKMILSSHIYLKINNIWFEQNNNNNNNWCLPACIARCRVLIVPNKIYKLPNERQGTLVDWGIQDSRQIWSNPYMLASYSTKRTSNQNKNILFILMCSALVISFYSHEKKEGERKSEVIWRR
jgi:hypothetical protein